ncbi:MAG: aminotransferase class IV, partial [Gammaproteobacteria bacterium]|nr:aminotransferase class IV [Gammaproteobacteria bacterium]
MHYKLISDLDTNSQVDRQDRGLHYGDGIFETMLLSNGKIMYWTEHYARLSFSAKKLYMGCPEKTWFEQNLQPFIDLNQPLIIKIILTRGSGGRGLSLPDELSNNIYILKYSADKHNINQYVKAIFSDIALP